MSKKTNILFLGAAVLLAVGGGWILELYPFSPVTNGERNAIKVAVPKVAKTEAPEPTTEDRAKAGDDQRLQDLEVRLVEMNEQLDGIRARQRDLIQQQASLARLVKGMTAGFERSGHSSATDGAGPSMPIISDEELEQQRVSYLEEQLSLQSLDPQWSTEALSELYAIIGAEALSGTTLLTATCQSSLCRAEFGHADRPALSNFFNHLSSALVGNRSAYYHVIDNPDGSVNTVVYVSREGYDLPSDGD